MSKLAVAGTALAVVALAACKSGTTATAALPTVSASGVATTAAPTHSAAPQTVTFEVTGTSGAQVTYGPAGTSLTGTVPMHVTQKLGHPIYYSVQVQLQGGGSVTAEILINGKVVSKATATGGYNIAMAEISQDPLTGGWQSDNG